ncbi:hypothetical protein [Caldivirga sp. UBA161]|uniref:hypothetical protein n=1 Tax=Caldivirga sp. UBA161 TaxID=1915569 RepID=UPI0025C1F877|nr:hypothetical protein [Caldivirga sp. UBA161]
MDAKTIGLIAVAVVAVVGYVLAGYFAVKPPMTVTTTSTATPKTVTTTVTTTMPTTVTKTTTVSSTSTASSISTTTATVTITMTTTAVMQPNMVPELIPVGVSTAMVNASMGATLRLGNIIVIIRPGTYVMTQSKQILSTYNFSIIVYQLANIGSPSMMGEEPVYAFAYAVNGHVSPSYTFVNPEGKPYAVITVVRMPNTWTTWTWLGFMQESNGTLVDGHYAFLDSWVYAGSGLFVNYQFVKPVPWIFVNTGMPASLMATYTEPTMSSSMEATTMEPELVPIGTGTVAINATQGGAVAVGNLLAIILPGTYVETPSGQRLSTYNFSLIYQAIMNIPPLNESGVYYWPLFSYAFAVNNQISLGYTFVNASGSPVPVLTVAFLPSWFTSWTWLGYVQLPDGTLQGGKYAFPNVWIPGDDYIVNTVFFKPVPWVFLAVEHGYVNMTVTNTTTTSTTASTSAPVWGG